MKKEHALSQKQSTPVNTPSDTLRKAIACCEAKKFQEAELLCKPLLAANPANAHVLNLMGIIYVRLNKAEEASAVLEKAIAINPRYPDAYAFLGLAQAQMKRYKDAVANYDKALALNPNYTEVYFHKGGAFHFLEQYEKALASYDRALALNPSYTEAMYYRGNALRLLKRFNEALTDYDKALANNPDYTEVHFYKGMALNLLGRHEEALASYDRALALNPNYTEVIHYRGNALRHMKRFDEALAHYNKVIALDPEYVDAYLNTSLIRLLRGEYAEGWKLYEWRKKIPNLTAPDMADIPLWTGHEPLMGKTILIYDEQGLGDTIQFCRYVPMVEALGAKVTLRVQPVLAKLISTLKGHYILHTEETYTQKPDFHCPLLSLPLAFGTAQGSLPAEVPYLYADATKQQQWHGRLGAKTKPRIGLVWSGAAGHRNDHNRSVPLSLLAPLLNDDYEFHSLQKEIRPADADFIARQQVITSHAEALTDFADTAALVWEMDLVLSVDTSVAHLTGALGKPVWIMLPFVPDWRWLLDRHDSPWYPTARLFRQQKAGRWESVIEQVKAALALLK